MKNKENSFGHCFDQNLYRVTFWKDYEQKVETTKCIAAVNVYHLITAMDENNKNGGSGISHPAKIKDIVFVSKIDRAYIQVVCARTVVRTLERGIDKKGVLIIEEPVNSTGDSD